MAIFNPQIAPTSDPNYLGYSRGTSGLEANRSLEALFKGLGSVVDTGAKAVDWLVKDKISTNIHGEVDKATGEYQQSLDDTRNALLYGGDAGTADKGVKVNYFNAYAPEPDKSPIDDELKNIEITAGVLASARANGKISQTDYLARLNTYAKTMRAQYPGHRDYIDQEMSKATGRYVAKDLLASTIGDINSFASSKGDPHDDTKRIAGEMLKYLGDPTGPKELAGDLMYQRFMNDPTNPEVKSETLRWLSKRKEIRAGYELNKLEREDKASRNQLSEGDLVRDARMVATTELYKHLDNTMTLSNYGTPTKLFEIIKGLKATDPGAAEKAVELGNALEKMKQGYVLATKQVLRREGIAGNPNADPKKIDEVVQEIGKQFDPMIAMAKSKEFGPLAELVDRHKAIHEQNRNRLLRHKEIGPFVQMMDQFKDYGPQVQAKAFEFFIKSNLPQDVQAYFKEAFYEAATQPGTKDGSNKVFTMKSIMEDAIKKGVDPKIFTNAKFYKGFVDMVSMIADPSIPDPMKENIAKWAFHPDNRDMLKLFQFDDRDDKGNVVAGKYSTFTLMTRPEITQQMRKLADKGNPEIWNEYKNWVEESFSKQLFRRDLINIHDLLGSPEIRIGWDTERKEFKWEAVKPNQGELALPGSGYNKYRDPGSREYQMIDKTFSRVNRGLANLADVANVDKKEVEAYLLRVLNDSKSIDLKDVPGVPQRFIDALNLGMNSESFKKKFLRRIEEGDK